MQRYRTPFSLRSAHALWRGVTAYFRSKQKNIKVFGLRILYGSRIKLLLSSPGERILRRTQRSDVVVRIGGKRAFRRIRKLIRRSTVDIVVQTFIWKDDTTGRRIAELLVQAARRGVEVHIMKDALGDVFEFSDSFVGTQDSTSTLWQEFWHHPKITIDTSSKSDHSKIWVFDGRTVLLSGMNIGEEYEYKWHDFLLELRGEFCAESVLQRTSTIHSRNSNIQIVVNNTGESGIRLCATNLIQTAAKTIVVEHCYLSDKQIIDALALATHRGVRVTIIASGIVDIYQQSNHAALIDLKKESDTTYLRILRYPKIFHSKVLLVDNQKCLIGSANFNTLSLDTTSEVCVLLQGRSRALKKIAGRLRLDVLRSRIMAVPRSAFFSRILGKLGF